MQWLHPPADIIRVINLRIRIWWQGHKHQIECRMKVINIINIHLILQRIYHIDSTICKRFKQINPFLTLFNQNVSSSPTPKAQQLPMKPQKPKTSHSNIHRVIQSFFHPIQLLYSIHSILFYCNQQPKPTKFESQFHLFLIFRLFAEWNTIFAYLTDLLSLQNPK